MANNVVINIDGKDNLTPILNQIKANIVNLKQMSKVTIGGSVGTSGGSNASGMGGIMVGAGLAIQALNMMRDTIVGFAKSVLDQARAMEQSQKRLSFTYGKGGAQVQMSRVGEFAAQFGLSKESTIESFSRLAVATNEAGLSSAQTQKIFESTTKASAAMGLSAEKTKGVFNALTQMISKGKVSMEELRLQLGDRLPGALSLAAKAMNMTLPKFIKMVEDGKVKSKQFVLALSELFEKKYGESASENLLTLEGKLGTLENAFFDLKTAIGQSLGPSTMRMVEKLAKEVEQLAFNIGKMLGNPLSVQNQPTLENYDKQLDALIPTLSKKELIQKQKEFQNLYKTQLSDLDRNIKENPELKQLLDPITREELEKSYTSEENFMKTYGGLGIYSPTVQGGLKKIKENRQTALGQAFRQLEAQPTLERGEPIPTIGQTLNPLNEQEFGRFFSYAGKKMSGAIKNTSIFESATSGGAQKGGTRPIIESLQTTRLAVDKFTSAIEDKDGGGDTDLDKDKLKTDYHTPKILNINILTGDGASLVNGGINTDINTLDADTTDIRQNIKDILLNELNDVVNDTATSLGRVAKASGAF